MYTYIHTYVSVLFIFLVKKMKSVTRRPEVLASPSNEVKHIFCCDVIYIARTN